MLLRRINLGLSDGTPVAFESVQTTGYVVGVRNPAVLYPLKFMTPSRGAR